MSVRFDPEAWVNDYPISVDPEGPTTFEVPLADAQNAAGEWLDSDECEALRDHANAPDWIRNWPGPFTIEIEHDEIHTTPPGSRGRG